MKNIHARLDALREKFSDESFLSNRGLSNEVGLYIFAYHPDEEMIVRDFVQTLENQCANEHLPWRVRVFDLYEILLDICRERRILDRIPQMERQRGQEFILAQIQRIAPPQAYIERMRYDHHRHGDVIVLTGIGRVFPYMRSHNILNNLQHVFDDIPLVLLYPGEYDGQSLILFERFTDDNYYRAFNIV